VNENFSLPRKPQLRRLTADEIELWLNATRSVAPRPGSRLPERPQAPAVAEVPPGAAHSQTPGKAKTKTSPLQAGSGLPAPLAPIERRLRQKLSRGRAAPDAAIDLHGMRCEEASLALRQFLTKAQANGAKLVLVVTGKGERPRSGDTTGILRKSVPLWLRGSQYHSIVAGFEEAARPHGGAGALYIRLRRRDRAIRGKLPP
jgi:DNA-nicking Smr family endonuclease